MGRLRCILVEFGTWFGLGGSGLLVSLSRTGPKWLLIIAGVFFLCGFLCLLVRPADDRGFIYDIGWPRWSGFVPLVYIFFLAASLPRQLLRPWALGVSVAIYIGWLVWSLFGGRFREPEWYE
jgi:hypothetical protein